MLKAKCLIEASPSKVAKPGEMPGASSRGAESDQHGYGNWLVMVILFEATQVLL